MVSGDIHPRAHHIHRQFEHGTIYRIRQFGTSSSIASGPCLYDTVSAFQTLKGGVVRSTAATPAIYPSRGCCVTNTRIPCAFPVCIHTYGQCKSDTSSLAAREALAVLLLVMLALVGTIVGLTAHVIEESKNSETKTDARAPANTPLNYSPPSSPRARRDRYQRPIIWHGCHQRSGPRVGVPDHPSLTEP